MKALKNIAITTLLLLILFVNIIDRVSMSIAYSIPEKSETSALLQAPEIQEPLHLNYLEIEGNSSAHSITDKHRDSLFSMLFNREIPLNFNFSDRIFIPVIYNFISPVSIFIRGHALLN